MDLHWLPLGAGGNGFVTFNGRVFEALSAAREQRPRCALYHAALEVYVDDRRWVIENAWPSPDADVGSRGVVSEGPVGWRALSRVRALRYEIRCWPDGVIADLSYAVGGPVSLSDDPVVARRLLDLTPRVPTYRWGRDDAGTGDMWNSNSVIAWLLATAGLVDAASTDEPPRIPAGGRAPGWAAGTKASRRVD